MNLTQTALSRRIVEELTRSVDQLKAMSRSSSGSVTLACMPSLTYQRVPLVIRKYAEAHPGNRVCILDRTSALVAEAVRQGRAEFGVMTLLSRDSELVEEPVIEDPFMLFCLNTHPLSTHEKVTWRDLRSVDLITFGGASGNRIFLDHQLAIKGIGVKGRFEVEQLSAAIGLVAVGVGVAILPASILLAETGACGCYPLAKQTRRLQDSQAGSAGCSPIAASVGVAFEERKKFARRCADSRCGELTNTPAENVVTN